MIAVQELNDRRGACRLRVTGHTECQFAVPLVRDLGPVRIENITMNGIGLRVQQPVEVGMIMAIGIRNVPKAFDRVHLVHVAHVTAGPDGSFLVGGTLDPPLTYQEFAALVT